MGQVLGSYSGPEQCSSGLLGVSRASLRGSTALQSAEAGVGGSLGGGGGFRAGHSAGARDWG
jgi:hypothetical protein